MAIFKKALICKRGEDITIYYATTEPRIGWAFAYDKGIKPLHDVSVRDIVSAEDVELDFNPIMSSDYEIGIFQKGYCLQSMNIRLTCE